MRLTALAAALSLAATPALADGPPCASAEAVLRSLMAQYHEAAAWRGALPREGYGALLLAAPDGKSWTIIIVRPDGMACPVMAGGPSQFATEPKRDVDH